MLKTVAIKNLRPNPFRHFDEYPILREKVDALKESISMTGFWGTVVGSLEGGKNLTEIAFGHHRLVALQETNDKDSDVEIIVRDLSNEDMIRMMARENMEEWGTSAWVELEPIRSVIDAYGKGEIELPDIPIKTSKDNIRHARQNPDLHPYTLATVAEFLGWTRKQNDNGVRPNFACETAFKAMDMTDAGFLTVSLLKGLSRSQMATLVAQQWAIYQSELRASEQNRKEAEEAEKRAEKASEPTERRAEKQAVVYKEQAQQHKTAATTKAKDFGKQAVDLFRSGEGVRTVKEKAEEFKPVVSRPSKVHNVDEFFDRIARKLESIASKDGDLDGDIALAKECKDEASPRAVTGLCQSFAALIARLERMRSMFKTS